MEIRSQDLPVIKAFPACIKAVAASVKHLPQRVIHPDSLPAMVFKTHHFRVEIIKLRFDNDISDTATSLSPGFRAVIIKSQTLDFAAVRRHIILAKHLIAAADQQHERFLIDSLCNILFAAQKIRDQRKLLFIGPAAKKQQVVRRQIFLFSDPAGIQLKRDAPIFAAFAQDQHVSLVPI